MEYKYLVCLYIQYCNSIKKNCNVNEFMTDKEFIEWLVINRERLKIYKNFLTYLGIDFNSGVAELNKGKYDSISDNDSTIISPFGNTLDKDKSELLFYDEQPIIISNSSISDVNDIELFTTHNPYNINYFRGMDKLHNIGYNIVFGVFGDISDFDTKDKLQYIEYLKKTLSQDYEVEYETINGTYICVLKSKRKIKRLKKSL